MLLDDGDDLVLRYDNLVYEILRCCDLDPR